MTRGSKPRLVIIQGPTATGKSELAVRLAEQFHGEIVNADSLQVYRGMVIGSAAPGPDLLRRARHHLIGFLEPDAAFSAADFAREAARAIAGIQSRGHVPFIVGGTGLYLRALTGGLIEVPSADEALRRELSERAVVEGNESLLRELAQVDPESAGRLHPHDLVRIIRALEVFRLTGQPFSTLAKRHSFGTARYETLKVGLIRDREALYRSVDERVERMLSAGFVAEVEGLIARGVAPGLKSMGSLGYKEVCQFLGGACSLEEAVRLIKRNTRRYLKRQLTWFLKDHETKWFEYPENFASICATVDEFLAISS